MTISVLIAKSAVIFVVCTFFFFKLRGFNEKSPCFLLNFFHIFSIKLWLILLRQKICIRNIIFYRIAFKSSVSKELKEISGQVTESSKHSTRPKMNPKTRIRIKRVAYDRRYYNKSVRSPSSPVTIVTVITIIRVALQIVGDEIYLSDILR